MTKQYPLDIDELHSDEEMWLMTKGHHSVEAFTVEAKRQATQAQDTPKESK